MARSVEKVFKAGILREEGFFYFLDTNSNIASSSYYCRGHNQNNKATILMKTDVVREKGFLYFIDEIGDISRSKIENRKDLYLSLSPKNLIAKS